MATSARWQRSSRAMDLCGRFSEKRIEPRRREATEKFSSRENRFVSSCLRGSNELFRRGRAALGELELDVQRLPSFDGDLLAGVAGAFEIRREVVFADGDVLEGRLAVLVGRALVDGRVLGRRRL